MYASNVWALALVHGPISRPRSQTLILRFATYHRTLPLPVYGECLNSDGAVVPVFEASLSKHRRIHGSDMAGRTSRGETLPRRRLRPPP
jgi:hypothetical protein